MNKRYSLRTLALLLALCLAFPARPAGAGDELAFVSERALQCGVHSETVDRVHAAVDSGEIDGAHGADLLLPLVEACGLELPLAPFEDKLEEGLSKHVRPQVIAHALQEKVEDYVFVRNLLPEPREKVDIHALEALAEGVSKGVPREDVEAYAAEFGGVSVQRRIPFLVGAEMVSLLGQVRFDYDLTRTMLEAGFASDSLTPEWNYLIRLVLLARERGIKDKHVASHAVIVLSDRGSLGDLYARLGITGRSLTGGAGSD
ncbi:hypothetical protein LF599_14365 [Pseudodesulfovibrio thermohalotolerans]|uniref:hypothetical protein n=1 Tax=Pseudodesulfovibrio thermohalotolerans TaxID=2880651 RepID=UPI00244187C3|nr:hypothetical protein [Pseudodesulfovibrio thermohalotolerans]WFS61843.1 hypothetical protein LF599_14365 [Pseudodesulfovibrio thermohalotolerans]